MMRFAVGLALLLLWPSMPSAEGVMASTQGIADLWFLNGNRVVLNEGSYRFEGAELVEAAEAKLDLRGTIVELDLRPELKAYAADFPVKAPLSTSPSAGEARCGNSGFVKVRLVEGQFTARTRSGRTVAVTEPNTVLTVCGTGAIATAQSSSSILNFTPASVVMIPPAAIAAVAVAAVVAVAVATAQPNPPPPPPVSP